MRNVFGRAGTANGSVRPSSRALLALGALGVVFGDIGTSPLYAFRVAIGVTGSADPAAVLGILSLIFWSLLLVVTAKYLGWILRADNEGEGGILALVALMKLHRRQNGPTERILLIIAIFGGALLFGDAILTPAISVLSAIEGMREITPALAGWTVPTAILTIAGLFLAQGLGVGRIGKVFGPTMLVWFLVLAWSGIAAIAANPDVLLALSPHHAVRVLWNSPWTASALLGAVFLAVTGGEALYADLGQFGRPAIGRAWLFVALPALTLNYFGQGSVVLASGSFNDNAFYNLYPKAILPFVVILATFATIIASQAVITGLASLSGQAIRLGFLPPLRVSYLSKRNPHDLYVPVVNAVVGLMTIMVVILFGSSDALAGAYGIAVAGAMITTTALFIAYQMGAERRSTQGSFLLIAPFGFLVVDLVFFAANAGKIASGGILPLTLAALVFLIVQCWRSGQARMAALQEDGDQSLREYLTMRDVLGPTTQKTAVFLTRPGTAIPRALLELGELSDLMFERVMLVSVRTFSVPKLERAKRVEVGRFSDGRTFRILVGVGYMQRVNLPALLGETFAELGIDPDGVTYLVGLERPVAPPLLAKWRSPIFFVYSILARLAIRPTDRFALPPSRTLEVGVPRYL